MPVTTVGIAGITGRLARLITHHLLSINPSVKIKGYCRDLSKTSTSPILSSPDNPNITIAQGDPYDPPALRRFVSGCDVVICAFHGDSRLMTEGQKLLIDACEAEGVKRYVAGDWTLDYDKLKFGEHPQKDAQKIVKGHLQEEGRTVKGVHILIGAFYETFWSDYFGVFRPGGEQEGVIMRYWGTGEEIWEGLSYDDAAKFTAEVALDEEAVGVKTFLGDRKSTKQLAVEFEEVYGVTPTLECLGTVEELQAKMEATRAKEPQNIFAWLADNYQTYIMNGQTYVPAKLDNGRYLDVKPATFKEFLQDHKIEELNGLYTKAAADI
ncbi:hypothetical protein QBC40DRAFT_311416 [Triangularia verruculosa]|uniref:NmrA-like domain-containing protein n=1 Tax=Triangularia verruculosa TaxID=2587418 RepID=A0AAN6X5J9_9PEZI|nr:hypothetical protein QBC40DRAFT_311416 [Triangularia verruculosa]